MLALILVGTDQSEETAALVDLVENGANLLRAVDCLLRDIHTLSEVSGEYTLSESCYVFVLSIKRYQERIKRESV